MVLDDAAVDDYRKSIGDAASAVESFVRASKTLRDFYRGRPNVARECPALRELQHQSDYLGAPEDQPVDNLASMIDLLTQAGNDSLRAVGVIINVEPAFVWAHLPTGRAALEAFAYSRWLAECPLEGATRVKRSLLMRLEDAKQLARFEIPVLTARSEQVKDSIRNFSTANGWAMSIGQMTIGGEVLINTKSALNHLFGDPEGVKHVTPKLWSYLSGASHGNPYALMQSIDQSGGISDGSMVTAALVVRARDVHNLVGTLILGGIRAWEMAARYFGWEVANWRSELTPAQQYLGRTARALAVDAAAASA